MWLHRHKKDKEDEPFSSSSTKKEVNGLAEKKNGAGSQGIRKKIMQFGSRVHSHGFGSSNSGTEMSAKEIQRLEETKNRLFNSGGQPAFSISSPFSHGKTSPLPTLRTSLMGSGSAAATSCQYSPAMSSESAASTSGLGTDFSYGTPKEFNVPGLSLPALAAVHMDIRELVLQRNLAGDFGFNVRRVQYPLCSSSNSGISGVSSAIVFAEPYEIRSGPPRPSDLANGILPGDQLLEVNGKSVESMTRDELLQEIQNSDKQIQVKVRAVPELAEFCRGEAVESQRSGRQPAEGDLLQFNPNLFVADSDGIKESSIAEDERYWLIHSQGYTLCRLLEHLADSKVRISVASTATEIIVDCSDVDRANPVRLDKVSDVAALKYLNETSTIHLLRQRFGSNLQYTNGGAQKLVCMMTAPQLAEDAGKQLLNHTADHNLVKMFRGCRKSQLPAHIYALAQQVYRNIQVSSRHQSVVFTGCSGSGKSLQLKSFVCYLCEVAGWTKAVSFEKLSLAMEILAAFGNCATSLNNNSSRFIQLLSLVFDTSAALCSAKIQTFLLETSRLLVKDKSGENTFHVFYYLWVGADQTLRDRLHFYSIHQPFIGLQNGDGSEKAKWNHLVESMLHLGIQQSQIDGIVDILAAIFHLNAACATQGNASKSSFINMAHAEHAASLLGFQLDQLAQAVFRGTVPSSNNFSSHSPSSSTLNRFSMSNKSQTGQESLNGFIQALYNELFSAIGSMINKILSRNEGVSSSQIIMLDLPGGNFNSLWTNSSPQPNSLNDLVFNYVNERVLELIYHHNFVEPVELYNREQVQVVVEKPLANPQPLVRLLDKKQQLLNCADLERRSAEPRGLFQILEEESMFPGATDDSFFERIFVHFEQNRLIRRHPRNRLQFILGHSLNTAPTIYSVEGWLRQAQPANAAMIVPQLLQSSNRPSIAALFTVMPGLSHSNSTIFKMRRSTQSIQSSEPGIALGGFFSNISFQLDYLLNAVNKFSRHHFVHCFQSKPTQPMSLASANNAGADRGTSDVLNVSFVRQQMRSVLLIDSIRAYNRGYPERMPFRDFRRRFQCLVDEGEKGQTNMQKSCSLDEAFDDRSCAQKILEKMEIFEHRYRLGLSQILLRNDVLVELEERRDLSLSGLIVSLQQQCRNCLANRWLAKRRVQEVAVKCIQRNARLHFQLRQWAWWNLYTRVMPLLSVVRIDSEHREWRDRIAALEAVNSELKSSKLRLEDQVSELEQLLKAECQGTQNMSVSLERESTNRMQLEAELRLLQQQQHHQSKEVEEKREQTKAYSTPPDAIGPVAPQSWWEQHAKTIELKASVERVKEQELSFKIKNQKTTEQLLDLRTELENLRSRNEQLEKKQRNFNNELQGVREKSEEVVKEKERLEKQCFEQNLASSKRNTEILTLKEENVEMRSNLAKLRKELETLNETRGDSADGGEVAGLRKGKRELETKIVELEDELDECLQKNQMLEQNITRLEMGAEKARADAQREAEAKETEIAELRSQYQRRLRAFEDQINDLSDANNSLLKQNRLLETRTRQLDSQSQASSVDLGSNHYKRELRRVMALYRDTQSLLAHNREGAPSQSVLRQLKEQLEDVEAAKLSALKSRHSLENELADLRAQLDMCTAAKAAAEDKVLTIMREKNSATALVQDQDEQLQELLKKYKAQIQQSHVDAISLADQIEQIGNLERAKQRLQEQLNELSSATEFSKLHTVEKHKMQLLELKLRDVQAKLDLETSHKLRLDSIVVKLREEVESLQEQLSEAKSVKDRELENTRKNKKETLLLQEHINELKKKETELVHKYKLQKSNNEKLVEDNQTTLGDLKLAIKRIDALQAALNADITAGSDIEEEDEFDQSEENISSFVDEQDRAPPRSLTNGVHSANQNEYGC